MPPHRLAVLQQPLVLHVPQGLDALDEPRGELEVARVGRSAAASGVPEVDVLPVAGSCAARP
jgi:hypothetical protein